MTKTTKTLIASAAIAGLISGAAVRAGTIDSGKTTSSTSSLEKMGCGGKEGCKGKNECKGKGGCKTDKNECKGKNDCKGKGGCKATEEKKKE